MLLCFDNFEAVSSEVVMWILRLREYHPSLGIRLAIAGRDLPGTKWDALRKMTHIIRLDVFSQREAEAFLDAFGITDDSRRKEILEYSGRLPVLMSWLSAPEGQVSDHVVPTHDIVERFLRWVPDLTLRQAALVTAIPQNFNLDVLKLLLSISNQSIEAQSIFDWLLTMPFVRQRSNGWQYHSVVRRLMLGYQKQKSPKTYQYMHSVLADFYVTKRHKISSSTEDEWKNEEWRAHTLTYAYHLLVADHVQHWHEIISLFSVALRKHRSFALEIIDLLSSDDLHDELSHEQNDLVQLFKQQLKAVEDGSLQDGFEMFNKLCNITGLSSQARCNVFVYRGDIQWRQGRFEEALADFDCAIALDGKDATPHVYRGRTYWSQGRFDEALADSDRAIALNDKDAAAFIIRGWTYVMMGRFDEALADLDRAIALNDKDAGAFMSRAETYRQLGRFDEALVDLDRAIALDGKHAWFFGSRGQTYQAMKRYEEALADFDHAITLDEKYALAIIARGDVYHDIGRYQEALEILHAAIRNWRSDESHKGDLAWALSSCANVLECLGWMEEALATYSEAMQLLPNSAPLFRNRAGMLIYARHLEEAEF